MKRVTRYSHPSAPEEDEEPTQPHGRNAQNALKKLKIHGKPTLYGERPPQYDDNVPVYHHRGGIYAVTNRTPQTWVDNQPARYRKRTSYPSIDRDSEFEDEDEAPRPPIRKRPRVVSFGEDDEDEPRPKRARRSQFGTFDGVEVDDGGHVDEDTPRRLRRNLPDVYYGRPRRQPGGSARNTPRKPWRSMRLPSPDIPNSRLYDYAVVGGKEEMSCQEAVRRRHQMLGLEVAPIENKFDKNSMENRQARAVARCLAKLIHTNTKMAKLTEQYEEVNAQIESLREARQRQRDLEQAGPESDNPPQIYRASTETEPLPYEYGKKRDEGPRTRSASPRAYQRTRPPDVRERTPPEKERLSEPLHDSREHAQDDGSDVALGAAEDSVEDDMWIGAQDEMQDEMHMDTADEGQNETHDETQDDALHDSQNETQSNVHEDVDDDVVILPERHDSLTEASLQQLPTSDSPNMLNLPQINKNGDRLRWSLPSQIQDKERAEAAIFRGRLPNESKSAQRRRVKREFKMVQNWAEMTATEPSEAEPDARNGDDAFVGAGQQGVDEGSAYED